MITLLTGCSDFGGSPTPAGSNGRSEASSVVRSYLKTVENGDLDEAMQFVHPEGEFKQIAEQQVEAGTQAEFEEITVETLEQDEETALVRSQIVTREGNAKQTMYLEVVLDNEEWVIYREVPPQEIDSEYLPNQGLTIKQRVQDVTPRDSFEVHVGSTNDDTELFYEATDVSEVSDLGEMSDYAYIRLDFSSEKGEEMQNIISNMGSSNITLFQYLDGEEIASASISRSLFTLKDRLWAENAELTVTYDNLETAKRVVATILDLTDNHEF
jgi:hypothetical protein